MGIANEDIRNQIVRSGLKYWEVASAIGISASTFSVWMRFKLDEEKRARIIRAIEELSDKKTFSRVE